MLARTITLPLLLVLALVTLLTAPRANAADAEGKPPTQSSSGFCLFEVPNGNGTQRFINLGIVQYVELMPDELRIAYGGGNLGSGHEARIPIKTREEGSAVIQRMRQTAHDCK